MTVTYGPGTYNSVAIPERAINITATVWGGGGGGGGATWAAFTYAAGGGGGSGGYIKKNFGNSQAASTINIIVGAGGVRGEATPSSGGNGGASNATYGGITINANGGYGGGAGPGSTLGSGGGGGTTSANGDSYSTGNSGGNATGSGSGKLSGKGGDAPGGGGAGGASQGNTTGTYQGLPGNSPGGGGSGARTNLINNEPGGVGGNGSVILSYDIAPLPNVSASSIADNSTGLAQGIFVGGNQVTITGSGFLDGNVSGSMGWSGTTAGTVLGVKFNGVAATSLSVNSNTSMTMTVPAYATQNIPSNVTVDLTFTYKDQYDFVYTFTKTAFYTYVPAASSYTHECSLNGSTGWSNFQYINAAVPVTCRIIFNNAYNGTVKLNDDYYRTVSAGLAGSFASSDGRFNPSTNTFTTTFANTSSSGGRTLTYTYTSPSWSTLLSYWNPDGSLNDNLYWPGIEVTTTPTDPTAVVTATTDAVFFGIWAEEYAIISQAPSNTICVDHCTGNFDITTFGAPYNGQIALSEDLSNSDNPSGTAGVFNPTTVDFTDSFGADMSFQYTAHTTALASPEYIKLCGISGSPAIADSCININVILPALYISGPTRLVRGQTGNYTLTVDTLQLSPGFGGTVSLEDLLGASIPIGSTIIDTSAGANPSGTFNPSTNTYTFTPGPSETYVRTFSYLMPTSNTDEAVSVRLVATADSGETGFIDVRAVVDAIIFRCGAGSPTCNIAYVGESKDYVIQPNGVFTGSAVISSTAGGSFSMGNNLSWNDASTAYSSTYIPANTGRHYISAATSSVVDTNMDGQTFYSTDAMSLNDYIWVMANQMTVTGDDTIANAGFGYFTLTMNGPFIGTVYLTDHISGTGQGGVFSNGGSCTFSLSDYNLATNSTSCTFTYTPTITAINRNITITPSVSGYTHTITPISKTTLAYGYPRIDSISPTEGPAIGGTTITVTGINFSAVSYVTVGGALCTNLTIVSDTSMTCLTPAGTAGSVDVVANSNASNALSFTYFDLATDFVNECYDGSDWTTTPFVDPGTTVNCRIILNGRHQGAVSIGDDYSSTIDPGLSGTFASGDPRFVSDGGLYYFNVNYSNTADSTGQTINYTYTSPIWVTLKGFYQSDGSTDDDLFWPMIEVDITDGSGGTVASSGDSVVFGLFAQEYYIVPDGNYTFYCVGCGADFIVSTYGAPYDGTITMQDILANSDNPSGTPGVFSADGISGNPTMDFDGFNGAASSFNYVPKTTAAGSSTYISLCGTSANPSIADSCYDISPVIDPGITIIPAAGSDLLLRGQTGTYTLTVTIGASWSGTIELDDVFSVGGAGGGVFADISSGSDPVDTFNSGTNTYTFTSGVGETYTRTFTYTLRDDGAVGSLFPNYTLQLTAESNSPSNQAYTNVQVGANRIMIHCAASYPNCTTAHVGQLQDYALSPNGYMVGSANVTASDAGALGVASWSSASAFTTSYTPTTPGRQTLTAAVMSNSINPSMIGQSFVSTASDSLNDYIYVMANHMAITGPSWLKSGATGQFTLTMNGPFVGTINLNDLLEGVSVGGVFDTDNYCTFAITDYDPITNTTSCTFDYMPPVFDDMTTVILTPSVSSYGYTLNSTPLPVLIYGRPLITAISPDSGPTTGGTTITLTGDNIAYGGMLAIDSITIGNIPINLAGVTVLDDNNISLVTPPNAAGGVDIVVQVGSHIYHHPDIFTYIPSLTSIIPTVGPTSGGTGFGASYNANGAVTITGTDITASPRYSDGVTQYWGIGFLDFDGSQYINTGTDQLGNTKMTLDMTRDSGLYAAGVVVSGSYFMITLPTTSVTPPTANYGNASAGAGGVMSAGDRIHAVLDANGVSANFLVSLNGGSVNANTVTPSLPLSAAYDIYIGSANNGAGTTAGIVGRIYGASIVKDTAADSRNFVPVCSGAGVGGLFDTINNVFYPSASATPFACDLTTLEPPTVLFGSTPATSVEVIDRSTIVAVPPPHAAGLVDVSVVIDGATATLFDAYAFRAPMSIEAIWPFTGELTGGDSITIYGVNFIPYGVSPSLTVTFDIEGTPLACTSATIVDNTTITCTTAARDPGLVSVTVSNGVETYTMDAILDPHGNGLYPTLDGMGRSTGGFLYLEATFIEIESSTDSVDLSVSFTTPFDDEYAIVSVITNNATGYELYMQSGGSTLICTDDALLTIPSTVLNTVSAGSWAYQIGASPLSSGWAAAPTSAALIDQSDYPTFIAPDPETPRNTQVYFAVREGDPTPISRECSLYEQTVTYSAYAK